MEARKSHFEDHMQIIETGHSKSAAAKGKAAAGSDLLTKLAQELGLGETEKAAEGVTAPAAPTAEGEVLPAASTIAEANPAVLAATDAVAMPQMAMAGGVPEIQEAGSAPNPETLVMPVISAADGNIQTASDLHRTPEAVAAAAESTEAEKIGKLIAQSFQREIEKTANDQEYTQALEILKEAGLLEGYNIKDNGMTKTAAAEGFLDKIASMQKMTKDDIIGAAYELVDFNKQAADAEEQGREAARNLVELMSKVAEESAECETAAEEAAEEKEEETEEGEKEANLKIASLMSDPDVVQSVKILKSKGLL